MDNLIRAQEWQKLAEMDLKSAEYLLNMSPIPIEIVCFHCQQSAEKYLKSYLILNGMNPPKIHDLDELRKSCTKLSDTFEIIADQCSNLTVYGVQPRYPMELILKQHDMKKAQNDANVIKDFVLAFVSKLSLKD